MRPSDFDDIIAEQAAQQQVLLMALRRIAALSRAENIDPQDIAQHWKKMGRAAIDQTEFHVAEGHEQVVRSKAKDRLAAIITIGLR